MSKTSIHIEPCKTASSETHNFRQYDPGKEPKYLLPKHERGENESWSACSVRSAEADARHRYEKNVGQKMQASATPIREGVVVIQPTTTMEQLQTLANRFRETFGIKCVQIHIHRDEGHKLKATRPDGGLKPFDAPTHKQNLHAHMVFDWTDSQGKSIKLKKPDMQKMQTITAEALEMERGVAKAETQAEHVRPEEWRNVAAQLEEQREALQTLAFAVDEKKKQLQKLEQESITLKMPSLEQLQRLRTIQSSLKGETKSLQLLGYSEKKLGPSNDFGFGR
jgi:hypothetical protein